MGSPYVYYMQVRNLAVAQADHQTAKFSSYTVVCMPIPTHTMYIPVYTNEHVLSLIP